jgi:hypothetical protein
MFEHVFLARDLPAGACQGRSIRPVRGQCNTERASLQMQRRDGCDTFAGEVELPALAARLLVAIFREGRAR